MNRPLSNLLSFFYLDVGLAGMADIAGLHPPKERGGAEDIRHGFRAVQVFKGIFIIYVQFLSHSINGPIERN